MNVIRDGRYLVVRREQFVARFPPVPDDELEELREQEIYVTVAGGPTYYATLMTLDAIDAVLRRWAETGEAAGGRYFFSTDLVITPRPGITAMIEAIEGLVAEGEIAGACQVVPHPLETGDSSD
ncbi:hypothetical protein M1L60_13025 [Actinoplanes sp. TRM 88003]|uniref:Uncharacterized protein n=1 Tax=Paractinoplanes aksuensis TaxID=2939490 RepID=A0ABT1DKY9_9ACTN|nr:hypothetical protein [Actinoplanes aksuensis]MCO8271516.1 hypothetical protein [Actinoplanes aksuensis]